MGLFDKFTETIFYKTDSELEEKVKVLTELQEQYPDNERINKDLLLAKLGLQGEKEIEYELKNANIGMYVLHDINLQYEDLTAQIDYIIITPGKYYYIECKNLVGNITVNERGDFIREWTYNKKTIKEGIYSPIRQAERHIEVYKKIRDKNATLLGKIFRMTGDTFKYYNVPLVVTANAKNILNTRYAPKEMKTKIIKSDQLIRKIEEDIKRIPREERCNKKMMEEVATIFLSRHTPIKKDYRQEYLEILSTNENNVEKVEDINNNIKARLIEYRTNKSKMKNIPAYYIFTNDELDRILLLLPKTLEELKHANILSEIKLKLHGEEIIKIINE